MSKQIANPKTRESSRTGYYPVLIREPLSYRHWLVQTKRSSYDLFFPAGFRLLDLTRSLRHRMGLRQKGGTSL